MVEPPQRISDYVKDGVGMGLFIFWLVGTLVFAYSDDDKEEEEVKEKKG
jgi:hypothetical protein